MLLHLLISIPKIYNILPPPSEELDEVLAFIYTGPCNQQSQTLRELHFLLGKIILEQHLTG
jgi:hypothetical protein